jgi:hypothetical protein
VRLRLFTALEPLMMSVERGLAKIGRREGEQSVKDKQICWGSGRRDQTRMYRVIASVE